MSGSALWSVRTAFFARLDGDATLQTLLTAAGRVFTAPPKNPPYPYCVLGNFSETPDDTIAKGIKRVRAVVHFVSTADGAKELEALVNRAAALFDGQPLTLANFTAIHVTHEKTSEARYDNAGVVEFVAPLDFDILAQEP